MKIKYEFANETVEIEVDEEWGNLLIDLDRQEYNNDHAETRRHCSLNALNLDDTYLPSDVDLLRDVIQRMKIETLYTAISELEPHQKELIKAIFFDGVKASDYAAQLGITPGAITLRKNTILRKLKKFLK